MIIDTIIEICALPVALITYSTVYVLLVLYRWTQEHWAEKYSITTLWASHVSHHHSTILLLLEPFIATQWAIEPFTPVRTSHRKLCHRCHDSWLLVTVLTWTTRDIWFAVVARPLSHSAGNWRCVHLQLPERHERIKVDRPSCSLAVIILQKLEAITRLTQLNRETCGSFGLGCAV